VLCDFEGKTSRKPITWLGLPSVLLMGSLGAVGTFSGSWGSLGTAGPLGGGGRTWCLPPVLGPFLPQTIGECPEVPVPGVPGHLGPWRAAVPSCVSSLGSPNWEVLGEAVVDGAVGVGDTALLWPGRVTASPASPGAGPPSAVLPDTSQPGGPCVRVLV